MPMPGAPTGPIMPMGPGAGAAPGMVMPGMMAPGGMTPDPNAAAMQGATGQLATPMATPEPSLDLGNPPVLTSLDAAATVTTEMETSVSAPANIDHYEFLFREDPQFGIIRQKYSSPEADDIRKQEINRRMLNPSTSLGVPAAGMPMPVGGMSTAMGGPMMGPGAGAAPMMGGAYGAGGYGMAGGTGQGTTEDMATWDFYYDQLEMYNKYVRNKALVGGSDFPAISYDPANYLQERQNLKSGFDESAIALVNKEREENLRFYETLDTREDRRQRFYEWVNNKRKQLDDYAMIWSRKVNGSRWIGSENTVSEEDWYYGQNFASNEPVEFNIDGQAYLMSRTPQRDVPDNTLNVIGVNLTPYNIIGRDGDLKTPEKERARGTIPHPPPPPETSGTIELGQENGQ